MLFGHSSVLRTWSKDPPQPVPQLQPRMVPASSAAVGKGLAFPRGLGLGGGGVLGKVERRNSPSGPNNECVERSLSPVLIASSQFPRAKCWELVQSQVK